MTPLRTPVRRPQTCFLSRAEAALFFCIEGWILDAGGGRYDIEINPIGPKSCDKNKRRVYDMERKVPIWEKANLTVEEAADYFGIGTNKLRTMTDGENCPFVLWVGSKRLIKRRKFEKFLEEQYSI